jgi:hypothetical protein
MDNRKARAVDFLKSHFLRDLDEIWLDLAVAMATNLSKIIKVILHINIPYSQPLPNGQ